MRKNLRMIILAALTALTLCAGAMAVENPVTITLVYDHDLCDFTVTDRGTGEVYDTDTIVLESGTSALFEVSNIAEGYRIAAAFRNGRDSSSMFIDGAYGGFSTRVSDDVTYQVDLERIPDSLPVVAKAVICAEQTPSGASKPVTELNTAELDGIHAVVYDTAGNLLPLYCANAEWEYSTDGGATWKMIRGWGMRNDMWFGWSGFEEMGMDYMNMKNYLVRAKVQAKEFYTSTGSEEYVISAPVGVNGGEQAPVDMAVKNIRFEMENNLPLLRWDAPEGLSGEVVYDFYMKEEGQDNWSVHMPMRRTNFNFEDLSAGVYNAVKIVTMVNEEAVGEYEDHEIRMTMTAVEETAPAKVSIAKQEDGTYLYTISGLTPGAFVYLLEDCYPTPDSMMGDRTSYTADENGVIRHIAKAEWMEKMLSYDGVYMVREYTDAYAEGKKAGFTMDSHGFFQSVKDAMEGGSGEPETPETGSYGVTLSARNNFFSVQPVVPEGTDEKQMYDIYLYSSETGKSFGNTEFYQAGGVIVYEEAGTYDCYRLLKNGTGEVLAEGKLEKPVITAWDLEVPEGVRVDRTEESDTKYRFTVSGIDLSKYGYELSSDGYGGTNRTEESFVISKNYFGDTETLYVCIFSAAEKSDAYYLNRSRYATVTLNSGEEGEKPTVSGSVSGAPEGATVEIKGAKVEVKEDGSFSIEAAEGKFDVVIKTPGALTHTVKNVEVKDGSITLPEIKPVMGDTNGDDMINIMDMGAFRQNFGKVGANIANEFTDVNGDGMVNIMDMGTFRQNFGKTAAKDCTVSYSA